MSRRVEQSVADIHGGEWGLDEDDEYDATLGATLRQQEQGGGFGFDEYESARDDQYESAYDDRGNGGRTAYDSAHDGGEDQHGSYGSGGGEDEYGSDYGSDY